MHITTACTVSPHLSLGMPMTAHCADGGVERDAILDLDGIDVLATRNDHVLDTIDDIDVAIFIHIAASPVCIQPSITAFFVSSGRSQ